MSIKSQIYIVYINLFSLFLNCFAQSSKQSYIAVCNLCIVANGLAIFACLQSIQRKLEK